ncbi:nitrate reductase [Gammaproteobacteria bacterium 42_54_T18]|nr:nitrate reductase [Gammaproteobacteria bacterium 42_54_T18]
MSQPLQYTPPARKIIKTTCAYCGVGCGVLANIDEKSRSIQVEGDQSHPANYGKLCSKGSALAETVTLKNRLLKPSINQQECSWEQAIDEVSHRFTQIIHDHGPDAIAFYGSGQLLTEDYYVANKLMKGFIGSGNMDTNSRLCMSSTVAGQKRAFGSDTMPGSYSDIERADLIVLIGSNTAWCHPILFQRIRVTKEKRPHVKVVVIDPRETITCDIADLHLPLKIGSDVALFQGLLHYLDQHQHLDQAFITEHVEGVQDSLDSANNDNIQHTANLCNIPETSLTQFYQWFADTGNTLSLYSQGVNQSSAGTDKVNAIINCHLVTGKIAKPGMGPFSLTGQPNAMGGREVGGLAHQLAAHMDFATPGDIDRVARFWQADNIARHKGLPAVELFENVANGKIKAIWIMSTNPIVSMPNANKVRQALQQCEFVVVSDCVLNQDTCAVANVLLPAAGWSEKDGTVTNSERRISRQRALFPYAGESKPDWWIITEVAKAMGFAEAFPYQKPADIFREHARLSGFENHQEDRFRVFNISGLADLSDQQYQNLLPIQWPILPSTSPDDVNGTQRAFADFQFSTPSKKAQCIPLQYRSPVNAATDEFPLILNTGRIRDQWHTMSRTALAPRLNQHKPEPFVEIHPDDAKRYQLTNGAIATIHNQQAQMQARIVVTTTQQVGNIFIPIHWTSDLSNRGRVGPLVNAIVDPVSFQPESKSTPVAISLYDANWYGFILSRQRLSSTITDYHVEVPNTDHYRFELAHTESFANSSRQWAESVVQSLYQTNADITFDKLEWQTYQDTSQHQFRAAVFYQQQLEAVIMIGPTPKLPERDWIAQLFSQTEISYEERLALLSGRPPSGSSNVGPIVCACFNVGENTIINAIHTHNVSQYQQVGELLKAGTNCGSCVPDIKTLIKNASKNSSN